VITADAGDSIQHVYNLIVESGFCAFPVLKKKKLAGIISRRDLLRGGRTRAALAHAAHTKVADLMTKDVITIGPG
jgi:CBS domain-containing protein